MKIKSCFITLASFSFIIITACSSPSLEKDKKKVSESKLPVINASMVSSGEDNKTPKWLTDFVDELNSKPVKDSPESIARYLYKGKTVYYFAPACCGKESRLFDKDRNLLCNPDGGPDGKGNGKCPDFMALKKDKKEIWFENRD